MKNISVNPTTGKIMTNMPKFKVKKNFDKSIEKNPLGVFKEEFFTKKFNGELYLFSIIHCKQNNIITYRNSVNFDKFSKDCWGETYGCDLDTKNYYKAIYSLQYRYDKLIAKSKVKYCKCCGRKM